MEFHLASTSKTQKKTNKALATKPVNAGNDGNESTKVRRTRGKKRSAKVKGDLPHPFHVNWSKTIPIWVKAMFVTDDRLVVAGPRDLYDEESVVQKFRSNDQQFTRQQEHMEGKHGSFLKMFNKADGTELYSITVPFMPTFDGMITANGHIYMTTSDGHVVCFAVK